MASTILSDNGVTSGTAGIKTTADSTGALALQTTTAGGVATTAVTIDTSQNVGIGVPNPPRKLSVSGIIGSYNTTGANDSQVLLYNSGSASVLSSTYASSGSYLPLAFYTSDTERARIDSSGNLLMAGGEIRFTDSTRSIRGGTSGQVIITAASGGFYQYTGSYYLVTTAGGSTSDETLKKNIQPIENALAKVCAISGITYEFIDEPMCDADKGTQLGVGAQTVEAQFPEIVLTQEDGKKTVRYDRLVAPLIEAIKEQQALITTLTERITALEAK